MRSTSQLPQRACLEDDPKDPLIGARLRMALTQVEERIQQALTDAGFADIQIPHFKVFRFPPPDDERPIDLAQRAGMSKQAMNYLLGQLDDMGYVQRIAPPGAATRLIRLTDKGWQVARLQRDTVRRIERDWARRIGRERFDAFYAVLEELTDLSAEH